MDLVVHDREDHECEQAKRGKAGGQAPDEHPITTFAHRHPRRFELPARTMLVPNCGIGELFFGAEIRGHAYR